MSKRRKNRNRNGRRWSSRMAAYCAHETAIVNHVARHVGPAAFVIHEERSEIVHLDVHVVPPGPDRDHYFLFTTGMSARPMTKPPDAPGSRFAEVSLALPSSWRFDHATWRAEPRWLWPIVELKRAALLPHRHRTWLGSGHTIADADGTAFDPSTRMSALLVVESGLPPIRTRGIEVDLLSVWPLYPEELAFRADHGVEALVDALLRLGVGDTLDPARPSAVEAKRAAFAAS